MNYKIPLSHHLCNGNENLYLHQAINSGNLATHGAFIEEFEQRLSEKLKTHEVVALNSGTSALHLAMVLLGIGSGDEVICQSFTFCASANPIVYVGAKPIFVDSESDTWNINPEILEDTILDRISRGKKPKAIVLVHLFGMPAKVTEIMEIASKYQIPILEDAAEAVGSTYNGKSCGTFGRLGVFSFNGNKIITAGGGGAIISNNSSCLIKARHLSTQAREDFPYYEHLEIGYNYKMNNMAAAVGVAQLEKLEEWIEKRRLINERYRMLLNQLPGISFQMEQEESRSNFWLSTILIDAKITGFSNKQVREALLHKSIETRFLWKPLHLQPVFSNVPFYGGKVAENLYHSGLCLPSSVSLTLEDQEYIVGIINSIVAKTFS